MSMMSAIRRRRQPGTLAPAWRRGGARATKRAALLAAVSP